MKFILESDLTTVMEKLDPEGVADATFAMGKSFEWLKRHFTETRGIRLTAEQEKRIRRRMKWLEGKERGAEFKDFSILEKQGRGS